MEMSSLQRRALGGAPSPPSTSAGTFESCFSAGLDLTEFGGGGNDHASTAHAPVAASAALAQRKAEAAAKRREEEREEAALERRVAGVVDASNAVAAAGRADDELDNSAPRALHPGNAPDDDARGRDDNFVRFLDGAGKGGFLSSLVSNHRAEGREGTLSHKSRALRKSHQGQGKRGAGRGPAKPRPKKAGGAKAGKKFKKSKH